MISIIYQILKLILMSISCHWSVVLVQGYILKQYNTLPPQSLRLLGNDSFLGQAPARECGCGWLNFGSAWSAQFLAKPWQYCQRGFWPMMNTYQKWNFPEEWGLWVSDHKKRLFVNFQKKKVKVDYVILFFKFKKNMAKFLELGFVQWDPLQV